MMVGSFISDIEYPHTETRPLNRQHVLLGRGPPEHLGEFTFGGQQWEQFLELTAQDDPGYDGDSDEEYEKEEDNESSEYSYPVSQIILSNSGESSSEGLECNICGRHQAKVRFRVCCHGACISCTRGIWESQKRSDDHFPVSFSCHQCGARITHFSVPRRFSWKVLGRRIEKEVPVTEWMERRPKRAELYLKKRRGLKVIKKAA